GRAVVRLRDPESGAGMVLWVDETFEYLMLFTGDTRPDVNRRSLAVEPMTCPPNAFRTGDSLIRLEPGQATSRAWGIAPARWGQRGGGCLACDRGATEKGWQGPRPGAQGEGLPCPAMGSRSVQC